MPAFYRYIKLCLGLLFCGLVNAALFGQNCLEGCTENVTLNGKALSFKYKILQPINGKITYEQGKYIVDIKEETKKQIELDFFDLPEELVLFFAKEWSRENFLSVKSPCKKITKADVVTKLRLLLVEYKEPSKAHVIFGVGTDIDAPCPDGHPGNALVLPFSTPNSRKAKDIEEDLVLEEPVEIVPTENPNESEVPTTEEYTEAEVAKHPIDEKPKPETDAPDVAQGIDSISPKKENSSDLRKSIAVTKQPKITPAEKAWRETKRKNTKKAYEDFVGNFPSSKYVGSAEYEIVRLSEIKYSQPKEIENGHEIRLANVQDIKVDTILNNEANVEITTSDKLEYTKIVRVTNIKAQRDMKLKLTDPWKPKNIADISIPLGNHLVPEVAINNDATNILAIKFNKGKAPFTVFFYKDGVERYAMDTIKRLWVPGTDFFHNNKLIGEITFKITDAEQSAPYSDENWKIIVQEKPSQALWRYLIGSMVLLLVGFFIYKKIKDAQVKRKRDENMSHFRKKRSATLTDHMEKISQSKASFETENLQLVEEGGNAFQEEKVQATRKGNSSGIVIKEFKKAAAKVEKYGNEKELDKILEEEISFGFDATTLWKDSMISTILFTEKSITALDKFLWEQNLVPLKEQEGQVPEIGGLLLGRPFMSKEKNTYRVLVDEFVPIDPEYHDVYQLEFSAQSMAKDLGDIQDEFPDLMLVGWFHTHPGHGLFLSRPDLKIHDSFFKESYQFAMEIDSISKRLDAGFFTRMKSGKVNNRKNLMANARWYSWLAVEENIYRNF